MNRIDECVIRCVEVSKASQKNVEFCPIRPPSIPFFEDEGRESPREKNLVVLQAIVFGIKGMAGASGAARAASQWQTRVAKLTVGAFPSNGLVLADSETVDTKEGGNAVDD